MTEIDEYEYVVMMLDSQPELRSLYRNKWLLFSVPGWNEPKLGMKRYRSDKKGTMYFRTTLKIRKTKKSPPKTEAGVDVSRVERRRCRGSDRAGHLFDTKREEKDCIEQTFQRDISLLLSL